MAKKVVKFMRLFTPEEKQMQTKKEMQKLKKLFKDLPKDKQRAAEGLIQEAAFMRVTLEETRHIIDQEGIIEHFEQGAQKFLREHPATKVYNAMINRYTTVCKQLFEMVPDPEAGKQAEDELMAFVKSRARK